MEGVFEKAFKKVNASLERQEEEALARQIKEAGFSARELGREDYPPGGVDRFRAGHRGYQASRRGKKYTVWVKPGGEKEAFDEEGNPVDFDELLREALAKQIKEDEEAAAAAAETPETPADAPETPPVEEEKPAEEETEPEAEEKPEEEAPVETEEKPAEEEPE
jgi:hypothetical protein